MTLSIPQLPAREPTTRAEIDRALARLTEQAQAWVDLAIPKKVALLHELVQRTGEVAERWVAAAARAKGLPGDSPLVAEEWTSGPWALMYGANHYARSLVQIAARGTPQLEPGAVRTRRDGQVVVEVFPQSTYDALLLNGIRAEVWMQPGVSADSLPEHMAGFYKQLAPKGGVALVLGAGNIASIAPMDVLHKLLAEGQVCALKLNPVNEYLGPFLAEAFAAFIDAGYLAIIYGGAEVGEYLCTHPAVAALHITGSAATHDAIVFGGGAEGAERKRRGTPLNPRPISSELGNVSPIIVVPGPWNAADLRYQAEHIATMKMHNGGFNCVAGQVLVLPDGWEHAQALLDEVQRVLSSLPNRVGYYPGAAARQAAAVAAHPDAIVLDPPAPGTSPRTILSPLDATRSDEPAFCTEAFGSVLGVVRLPCGDAAEYLHSAVRFCNETLLGTLGANILIHPSTMESLGEDFEAAIAALRYGCIAINAWTGVGFLLCQTSWGAFPGHTLTDVQSGIGVVHNTLFFDRPQKSVVRQSFYPCPRSFAHGDLALLPRPPWFITNRTAAVTARRLVEFERAPSVLKLPGIFASALRG